MMPGRPNGAECIVNLASEYSVYRSNRTAGSQARNFGCHGIDVGITGAEMLTSSRCLARYQLNIGIRVNSFQLFVARQLRRKSSQILRETGFLNAIQNDGNSVGLLRMVGARYMLAQASVGN
jgi:hypothetical protein